MGRASRAKSLFQRQEWASHHERVFVPAVVLDGMRVEDPSVAALLEVLAPLGQAELATGGDDRRDGLEPEPLLVRPLRRRWGAR